MLEFDEEILSRLQNCIDIFLLKIMTMFQTVASLTLTWFQDVLYIFFYEACPDLHCFQNLVWERSGSVVECLT